MQFPFVQISAAIYNSITGANFNSADHHPSASSSFAAGAVAGASSGFDTEENLIAYDSDDEGASEMSQNPVTTRGPLDSHGHVPPALPLTDLAPINIIRPGQQGNTTHGEYYAPDANQVFGAGLIPPETHDNNGAGNNGGSNSAGGNGGNDATGGGGLASGENHGNTTCGGPINASQHPPPPPGLPQRPEQVAQAAAQAAHAAHVQAQGHAQSVGSLQQQLNILTQQNKSLSSQLAQLQSTKLNKVNAAQKKDIDALQKHLKYVEKELLKTSKEYLKSEERIQEFMGRLKKGDAIFGDYRARAEEKINRLSQDLAEHVNSFQKEMDHLSSIIQQKDEQISKLSADIAKISNSAPDAVRDDHYLSGKLGQVFLAIQNYVVTNFMRGKHDEETLKSLEPWVVNSFLEVAGQAWAEALHTDHITVIKALLSHEITTWILNDFLCGLPEEKEAYDRLRIGFQCTLKQEVQWRMATVTMLSAHQTFTTRLDAHLNLLATRLDTGLSPLSSRGKSTPARIKKLKAVLTEAALISIECQKEPSEFKYIRAAIGDPCNSDTMIDASGTMEGEKLNKQAGVRMVVTPAISRRAFEGRAEEVLILKAQVLVILKKAPQPPPPVPVSRKNVPSSQAQAQAQHEAAADAAPPVLPPRPQGPVVEVDPAHEEGAELTSEGTQTQTQASAADGTTPQAQAHDTTSSSTQTSNPSATALALQTFSPDSAPTPTDPPQPIPFDLLTSDECTGVEISAAVGGGGGGVGGVGGGDGSGGQAEQDDTVMKDYTVPSSGEPEQELHELYAARDQLLAQEGEGGAGAGEEVGEKVGEGGVGVGGGGEHGQGGEEVVMGGTEEEVGHVSSGGAEGVAQGKGKTGEGEGGGDVE
ncbi:hypothetical protein DFH27DRAFT_522542 [Peziza echinospora]|nr:hypothetical protein DFH27DRAFT_522542 [Peziza echinospora]